MLIVGINVRSLPETDASQLLKTEIAEGWMIFWTGTKRPVVLTLLFRNWQIIDAGNSPLHSTVGVEFPVFIAVAAEPIEAVVMPLISKAHCNTIFMERPNLFDQPVVELAVPFAGQESNDGLATDQKFCPISPNTVDAISESDLSRIARVPGVFGFADLVDRS